MTLVPDIELNTASVPVTPPVNVPPDKWRYCIPEIAFTVEYTESQFAETGFTLAYTESQFAETGLTLAYTESQFAETGLTLAYTESQFAEAL